jgi:hypothetical protein
VRREGLAWLAPFTVGCLPTPVSVSPTSKRYGALLQLTPTYYGYALLERKGGVPKGAIFYS